MKLKNKKTVIRAVALTLAMVILACICVLFTGCVPADTSVSETSPVREVKSEYAILRLPDDTIIQGNVGRKYTSSVGTIEIEINGVEYKTHWANVAILETME